MLEARGLRAVRNDQTFIGGKENPDIGLPGLHVEVKRVEALKLAAAITQAADDAAPGTLPVVMHRRNRGEWTAIMRLDDFLRLYKPYMLQWAEARDRELDAEYERVRASEQ